VAADCVALREGRVAELPAPRRRGPLPLKRATWVVLEHQGRVLLERRPSRGLWGGLWVFPDAPSRNLKTYCRKEFSASIRDARKMPVIEHGFTHFRLDIQPILCSVRRRLAGTETGERLWLDLADAAGAAVPAPVRTLLSALLRDQAV
jgi:A/G-specific adenine glycosylase